MKSISIETNKRVNKTNKNVLNVYMGIVVDNNDPNDLMRLKVRIDGLDNDINDDDLPYALPIIPKFLYILPKVGEAVRIIISDINKPYNLRSWIGSVISQPQLIDYDPYYHTALNGTDYQKVRPLESVKNIKDGKQLYPSDDDIAVIGRYNTDIIQRRNEILLRCGIRDKNNKYILNRKNPTYLKMSFNKDDVANTMIVSDRIGFMSHLGKKKYNSILDENEIEEFFKNAHSLPKGDLLIKALEIFRDVIVNHVHGGSNLPANNSNLIKRLKELNLQNILSDNIKIN